MTSSIVTRAIVIACNLGICNLAYTVTESTVPFTTVIGHICELSHSDKEHL